MLNGRAVRVAVVGVVFSVVASCGGGVIPKTGGTAQGSVSGVVFKGPVAAGSVRALKLSATLERGDELASTTTDADGLFELKLPPYSGPLLIVASSGTYIEEAIGLGVKLDGNELTALIPAYTGGAVIPGVRVTPVSSLATALATFHVRNGKGVAEAHEEARLHLNAHFGAIDWSAVSPADLTVAGVTNLSPEARAGLLISGLSWLAKQEAEASDLTPGLTVNGATLTAALVRDASDGTLDGRVGGELLKQGKVSLSGVTLRADLVQAMTAFVNSNRNASALRLQDVTALLAAVGTNNDPYLFCPGQMAAATCGTGPVDTEPPVLAFVRPTAGAGVAGSTQVEVHASDNVKLKTLKFTSPPSLLTAVPSFTNSDREGVLSATLDVSALPDGPVEIRAEVTDESGNPAVKSVSITVSNQGPRISITSPGDGVTVRGSSVVLAATAQAQAPGATIARIELVNAPAGMGMDILPAADSFSASWNSTAAPEGSAALTLRAVDSFGTSTETTISVTVDNVAPGQVSAVVSAGAPVDGLTVKLVAVDEVTGLPVAGRLGGPILGQSTGVTVDGGVSFELTQENYVGPVQLVAEGASVSYVDPSDGVTDISLPSTFVFTSYVESYRTGDRLDRPVTYWTTLADAAARAYAAGRNPAQTTAVLLPAAMRAVDPLFARHITTNNLWNSRTVYPVSLTTASQSLRDVVFAAFADVALNQEARDLAGDVGLTPGTGFAAPQLVQLLLQDIDDGQFDGRASGVQLRTGGVTPYDLDANTTRFRQAIGLDRFIRSALNHTGLTRQDLQTQSIYDTMSGDTSLLYPSSVAPVPFDNVPPVVTWTVTFANGGQMNLAPYLLGSTKLVGGVVSIQASATDVSGMASLSVDVNGQQLAPAMGSTTTLFKAAFDTATLPDGTFTFTSTACDRLANCGPTTYVVDSDNTAPTVSPVKPLPGFYSASFDVEALASDNNRLASFDVSGVTGLSDQDAQLNRVYAPATSWSVPGGQLDGPLPIAFAACDVVRNCSSASVSPTLDRTPPAVTITSNVPLYTNQGSLMFAVSVGDGAGAGVSRVLVSLNGAPAVPLTSNGGGAWSTTLSFPSPRVYAIAVWAEDLAVPSNSGQGRAAPAQATTSVLLDTAPPVISFANFASYIPETGLNFQRQASGAPVMPAVWTYQTGSKIDVSPDTVGIVKAASRLSWGPAAPTGAELEGPNSRNVPFVQAQVGYNTATDSPITQARFRFTTLFGTTAWTNAIPAARTATNTLYFDCPVALETLPNLTTWGSTTRTFILEVNMTDAAGNTWTWSSGSSGTQKTFLVVPPPVAFVRDTSYAGRGDAKSIYNYRIANQTYDDFFDPNNSNFATDNYARHTRFVVYNPSESPVAINVRAAGASVNGTQRETWTNVNYVVPTNIAAPGTNFTNDGFTFRVDPNFDSRAGSNFMSGCGFDAQFVSPCGTGTKTTLYPAHVNGSGSQWSCQTVPLSLSQTWSTPGLGALGAFKAFKGAITAPTGVETTSADTVTTGYVVPGASGTTPGSVAVYQASPRPTRGSAPALNYGSSPYDATSRYQIWRGDMWVPNGDGYSCNISRPDLTTEAYALRRWYQQLVDATSTFNTIGATLQTSGVTAAAPYTLVGGFTDYATDTASITFSH